MPSSSRLFPTILTFHSVVVLGPCICFVPIRALFDVRELILLALRTEDLLLDALDLLDVAACARVSGDLAVAHVCRSCVGGRVKVRCAFE